MTIRTTNLLLSNHDGTSQRGRAMPALDPGYARVDERSSADLIAFVQAFVTRLRYYAADPANGDAAELRELADWGAFANHPDVSVADIVAYIAEPQRFTDEKARWLGRPHFALLLTFIELLGRAREQLTDLTARHLDYYYREILRMQPTPPRADRVAIVVRLASGVAQLRLPAGTALQAGRDSKGLAQIYETERELIVNRAEVTQLRTVFAHRRVTGIPDARADRSLTGAEAFEETLKIALGVPEPGDPVPMWWDGDKDVEIDHAFIEGLRGPLDITRVDEGLFLDHHELRTLMRLVHRRESADHEWAQINALLGVVDPADPRDFHANLRSRFGELDFEADGLVEVDDIDDLYRDRTEAAVRAYIKERFNLIGYRAFIDLMSIKRRIDLEWAEINRLIERAGRRQRRTLAWSLGDADPTAFATNLAAALAGQPEISWPWGTTSITEYETKIRELERHLSMTVERVDLLVGFAKHIGRSSEAELFDWSEVDWVLAEGHCELIYAGRRELLAAIRGDRDNQEGLNWIVANLFARPPEPPEEDLSWEHARIQLQYELVPSQLAVLDHFFLQLSDPVIDRRYTWTDVYRVLELAQRHIEGTPDPVARKLEWRNLYAEADARAQLVDAAAASPRWKTFGGVPLADEPPAPAPNFGFALRSPALSLSQGSRRITLTLGFTDASYNRERLFRELGVVPSELSDEYLRKLMDDAWVVEVSTAKGWIELPLDAVKLASGEPDDDYWSLQGVVSRLDEKRPALQFQLFVDPIHDPLAPLEHSSEPWPCLRLHMRQRWDAASKEWTTLLEPFEALRVVAAHLEVEVEGLDDLRLAQDGQRLDAHKPFEPFGASPAVGARFYLSHPELVRARLDMLRFDIEWMSLPPSLAAHYTNYPARDGEYGGSSFEARIVLVDRSVEHELAPVALFEDDGAQTRSSRSFTILDRGEAIGPDWGYWDYTPRVELEVGSDLRAESRYLRWELTPVDFGHTTYPSLAASKATELSVALTNGEIADAEAAAAYLVEAPYIPTIKGLSVSYRTSVEIDLPQASPGTRVDQLLHLHPFGEALICPEDPGLLPRYDQAGELYIALEQLEAPQHLSLLVQLAEGTSDPEADSGKVSWACLDGDRWRDLGDGHLIEDGTRGLINSGIVELALPPVSPSLRVEDQPGQPAQPGQGLYWLRAAIPWEPTGVCAAIAIQAQAVSVLFADQDNAADHYDRPLAVGSIDRLVEPDARIRAIEQPFTSFGGKPSERPELFNVRVSERLRHKQRALSPWDYERIVLQRFPQIYKVKCLSATHTPGEVDLIVIPDIRETLPRDTLAPKAPANLLADIQSYVGQRAPAAARVRVRNAKYVPIKVRLGVSFIAGQDEAFAAKRLNQDLLRFLSPWAYDEGADLVFGGQVYATSIIDFVDRCDYVDFVAEVKLFRSRGLDYFEFLAPEAEYDYHIGTTEPDQVLVAAPWHVIDVISDTGYKVGELYGINYMMIELDSIVG